MNAPKFEPAGDKFVLTIDDPSGLNDGQSDAYRSLAYQFIGEGARSRVAVDLGPVEFLSSSGVAFLVGLRKRVAAQKGQVVLFGINPHVTELLRGMKLAPLFPTAANREQALALFPPLRTE